MVVVIVEWARRYEGELLQALEAPAATDVDGTLQLRVLGIEKVKQIRDTPIAPWIPPDGFSLPPSLPP